jgi:hypothetical protein
VVFCFRVKFKIRPSSSAQSFILLLQITIFWDVKLCSSIEIYRRFGEVYNLCPVGRGSTFLRNCCTGLLRRLHSAAYQRAIIFISPLRETQISSFMQNSNFLFFFIFLNPCIFIYIPWLQPTRCHFSQSILMTLYMFRVVSPPIVRSSTVHTASGI